MLIFYLIAAGAAWAFAYGLNETVLKNHPSGTPLAILMSITVWTILTILLTAAVIYDHTIAGLPTPVAPDIIGSTIAVVVFWRTLNRKAKGAHSD